LQSEPKANQKNILKIDPNQKDHTKTLKVRRSNKKKRVIGKDTTLKIPSIGTFSKPETLLRKFPQIFASNSSNFEK
jgi:hypothetical protein